MRAFLFALYWLYCENRLYLTNERLCLVSDLNPKQERFCQLYVELGNASEAYRQAYNSTAKMNSVNVSASQLLSQPNISIRVEQIREATRANHNITLSDILRELEEARSAALSQEKPQAAAAVAATMGKAKLLGFDKEKKEEKTSEPIVINFATPNAAN